MSPRLLIYGATGYTGRLVAEEAKTRGPDFAVAGRSADKLAPLARALDVPFIVFDVAEAGAEARVDSAIAGAQVVLNCAGPYAGTAEPLMRACVRVRESTTTTATGDEEGNRDYGPHYLDVSAELDTYALLAADTTALAADAEKAGVMLMPGCGGSAAVLGCFASQVVGRVSRPVQSMEIVLHAAGSMSRGSALSAAQGVTGQEGVWQRREGRLVPVDDEDGAGVSVFDFCDGRGPVPCLPVTLPDLITTWKATGVGNIKTFLNLTGDGFPNGDASSLPDGPSAEERQANPYHAAIRVTGSDGSVRTAALHTINGYTFTSIAAVEAARRVLAGEARPGFATPVEVFGNTFIEKAIRDTKIIDLS